MNCLFEWQLFDSSRFAKWFKIIQTHAMFSNINFKIKEGKSQYNTIQFNWLYTHWGENKCSRKKIGNRWREIYILYENKRPKTKEKLLKLTDITNIAWDMKCWIKMTKGIVLWYVSHLNQFKHIFQLLSNL
jgi:hypothetical protein